jgi:hypothetical protein
MTVSPFDKCIEDVRERSGICWEWRLHGQAVKGCLDQSEEEKHHCMIDEDMTMVDTKGSCWKSKQNRDDRGLECLGGQEHLHLVQRTTPRTVWYDDDVICLLHVLQVSVGLIRCDHKSWVQGLQGEGCGQHHARWDTWLAAWDWSGWEFVLMHQRTEHQVMFFVFKDLHIESLYLVQNWINTVYFVILKVKNKPCEVAVKVRLFLGLLAGLRTSLFQLYLVKFLGVLYAPRGTD